MKKLISFLGSLLLIGSSSTLAVSCWWDVPGIGIIASDCYDENWNNVTDVGSDNNQWWDIKLCMTFFSLFLSRDIFPDSTAFYKKLNNQSSRLIETYFKDANKLKFEYDFTFLITKYDSITSTVIAQMQENELKNKSVGTYLFLNLPYNNVTNIENELLIDFQFIFMIKDETGNIIGNKYNSWFYWLDWEFINWNAIIINADEQNLLTLSDNFVQTERVVTNYF